MEDPQATPALPAAPAPAAAPPSPVETPQDYDNSFGWLDEAASYAMEAPPPSQYQPPPTPPQHLQSIQQTTKEQLVRDFIADPEGFIDRRTQERTAREVGPIKEMLGGFVKEIHLERVGAAVNQAVEALKRASGKDPAIQNEAIRREIASTYFNLAREAVNGNQYALNALRDPRMAATTMMLAKQKFGATNAQGYYPPIPVNYQGGRMEGGSTVGSLPVQPTQVDAQLMADWKIPADKWFENERLASR